MISGATIHTFQSVDSVEFEIWLLQSQIEASRSYVRTARVRFDLLCSGLADGATSGFLIPHVAPRLYSASRPSPSNFISKRTDAQNIPKSVRLPLLCFQLERASPRRVRLRLQVQLRLRLCVRVRIFRSSLSAPSGAGAAPRTALRVAHSAAPALTSRCGRVMGNSGMLYFAQLGNGRLRLTCAPRPQTRFVGERLDTSMGAWFEHRPYTSPTFDADVLEVRTSFVPASDSGPISVRRPSGLERIWLFCEVNLLSRPAPA